MPRIEEFDKETVLKQAMNIFWEQGYNGTSMQDLVDATGLNRSSIYNSFGSKLELYQETLRNYQKDTGILFQRALLNATDPLDAIRRIFEGFLPEMTGQKRTNGCFSMNCKSEMGNRNEDVRRWLLATQEQSLSTFQSLIHDGQEQGLINKNRDCRTYAFYVFNAFQGFRMTGILVSDTKILKSIINQTIELLQ